MAYSIFYVPTLLLLILTISLYVRLLYTELASKYLQKIAAAKKPYYQLFVSVYVVTAVYCWIYIIFEIIGVGLWLYTGAVGSTLSKFVLFVLVCSVTFGLASCIGKEYSKSRKDSTDWMNDKLVNTIGFFLCGCCCNHVQLKSALKYFVPWTFLLFFSILIWSLIPTIILLFVNPVQTLAVVLLSLSFYFLVCTSLAIWVTVTLNTEQPTLNIEQLTLNTEQLTRKHSITCLNGTIAIALTFSFLFMAALAMYFLHKGVNTGGVLGFILALAPGAITAIAAWFSKKILAHLEDDPRTEDNKPNQQAQQPVDWF